MTLCFRSLTLCIADSFSCRESQACHSLWAAVSISYLDSEAAYSSGSSETSALLPCKHKQLCQPLLH